MMINRLAEQEVVTEWKIEPAEESKELEHSLSSQIRTFDAIETLNNMRLAFGSE